MGKETLPVVICFKKKVVLIMIGLYKDNGWLYC